MKLYFIPFAKYDMVKENYDGTLVIPKHIKLRYLYTCLDEYQRILILNSLKGGLFFYDIKNEVIEQLNLDNGYAFKDSVGLGIFKNYIVLFSKNKNKILFCNKRTYKIVMELNLNHINVDSLFVKKDLLYLMNIDENILYIFRLNDYDISFVNCFRLAKGIGNTSIYVDEQFIYITDNEENLLRCYDGKGNLLWECITPFIDPIGQIWINKDVFILYGGLVNEVGYENKCWQEQKPFFHKLNFKVEENDLYTLTKSNAFNVTFFYKEEFFTPPDFLPAKIKLAIPTSNVNQKVNSINFLGVNGKIIEEKQRKNFFLYELSALNNNTIGIGYVANIDLQSIKYTIKNPDLFKLNDKVILSPDDIVLYEAKDEFFDKFVIDEKINDLDKVLKLRNIIFEKLYYKLNKEARSYKEILEYGYGTCGDYATLILILLYKNNITCESATGYKIPKFYISQSGIYSIYYNHTWIEIFDQNMNPYPFETSSDDKSYNNRFCEGQFLGLDWSHIKLYSGPAIPNLIQILDTPKKVSPFDYFRKAQVFAKINDEVDLF